MPALSRYRNCKKTVGDICLTFAILSLYISTLYFCIKGGGGPLSPGPRPFNLKTRFDLWVGVMAWTVDMYYYQKLDGCFGSTCAILPMWGLGAKNGSNLAVKTIWFVSTSWSFWCGRMSKSDKKWPSYAHPMLGQKWRPGFAH